MLVEQGHRILRGEVEGDSTEVDVKRASTRRIDDRGGRPGAHDGVHAIAGDHITHLGVEGDR